MPGKALRPRLTEYLALGLPEDVSTELDSGPIANSAIRPTAFHEPKETA